jgi:lipopolysaccharide export system protein LptA
MVKTSLTYILLFLLGLIWSSDDAIAQQKIVKLIHADVQEFDASLGDMQRLLGHVQFEYQGTMLYCDSAYLYNKTKDFDAYSNVSIRKGSDYSMIGEELHLDQKTKIATVQRGVILRDKEMTLTTDYLLYNMDTEVASYMGGGTIVSRKNSNTLTSKKGYYHSKTETFYFREKVVLKNPDYLVKCDTLQYNSISEVSYFLGPTTIKGSNTDIYCENGMYDSKKDFYRFGKNAVVTSKSSVLKGDSIAYNGKLGIGEVFGNVMIRDTTDNYQVNGDKGFYNEGTAYSWVTGHAYMTQYLDTDTLYMGADTLMSREDSLKRKIFYAFHGVKLYKSDMQGKADSLVYSQADSTIQMFVDPILWSDESQITGDSITIHSFNGKLDHMFVRKNALVLSKADSTRFNRIQGRELTGYFLENHLHRVWVEGNGQLTYYPTDDKSETPKVMGQNTGECSNIELFLKDNKVTRIKLHTTPSTIFTPNGKIDTSTNSEISWRGSERPGSMLDIVGN